MQDISKVQSGYDRWSPVYDTDGNPMQALEGPIVRRALGPVKGLSALDLGCGTGRHSLRLSNDGANVTALDFSDGMLEEARNKPGAESINFISHDLRERLPFSDRSFDLVVSGLVLEHLEDISTFFAEIFRVIKPGGRAVISAMHPSMFLRGSQARFTDPESGELVRPGSIDHKLSEIIMATVNANLRLDAIEEHSPDMEFVSHHGMRDTSIDWPMLVVLQASRGD